MCSESTTLLLSQSKESNQRRAMKITKNISFIALILSLSSEQCLAVINGGALIGAIAIDTVAGLASAISSQPSSIPSSSSTFNPTAIPSAIPSMQPSLTPSLSPSTEPSLLPSGRPSLIPSSQPSSIPTVLPSSKPSLFPSSTPSLIPTKSPSFIPTLVPSSLPTGAPSKIPTQGPTVPQKLQSSEIRPTNNDNDRIGNNNRGDNQQDFLVTIILSSGIGALALVLGAVMFVFHRHKRRSLASEESINDDDLAIFPREEPRPLPAPKEFKKQLSRQVKTGKATPMQMDMDMNRNMPRGDLSFDETDEGGLISEFDPSTIQSEKTSVWGKRIERDASYEIESKISGLSNFVLPSVFDPSTIRTEGSMARRQREPSIENFNFFSDESIPDQIFFIDEEDYEME